MCRRERSGAEGAGAPKAASARSSRQLSELELGRLSRTTTRERGGGSAVAALRRALRRALKLMDAGMVDTASSVVVLGATNCPWAIDPAMRRRPPKLPAADKCTRCSTCAASASVRALMRNVDGNLTILLGYGHHAGRVAASASNRC